MATKSKQLIAVCTKCGSDDVRRNCDAAWSVTNQRWEVAAEFDSTTCEQCGGECDVEMVVAADYRAAQRIKKRKAKHENQSQAVEGD